MFWTEKQMNLKFTIVFLFYFSLKKIFLYAENLVVQNMPKLWE